MMTIEKLYKTAKANNKRLLGTYSASWWTSYGTQYQTIDRYFARKFKSFVYRYADEDATDLENLDQFIADISAILTVNNERFKRLSELMALTYDITGDFSESETIGKEGSFDKGARTDTGSTNQGAQTASNDAYTKAYDAAALTKTSGTTAETSARTDTTSMTSGAEHDETSEETTREKSGNHTNPTDNARKYATMWMSYTFYDDIFEVLSRELLKVGD